MYFKQINREKIVFLLFWIKKKSFFRPEKETFNKVQKFEIFQEG